MPSDVRGIIVLEGADAVGKTTLARHLVNRYDGTYLHNGVYEDMWASHLAVLKSAVTLAQTQLVVIDRLWLSEQVYGQVFRGGPAYDLGARCFDRVLQRHGALTVLCVRQDQERYMRHFTSLKSERHEQFKDVARVARLYADLARGDLTKDGDAYLDQLIRYGDYAQRPDVVLYDMDAQGVNHLDGVTGRLAARLMGLMRDRPGGLFRDTGHPNLVGGIQGPEFLFVGEALSPKAEAPWPFFWNDVLSGATWLNRALHSLAFDETRALWTNAQSDDPNDWLGDVVSLYPKIKLIALGGTANKMLDDRGLVSHAQVAHPQWHRRFRAAGGTDEYAQLLKEAMR